jgi:hypothetical protein
MIFKNIIDYAETQMDGDVVAFVEPKYENMTLFLISNNSNNDNYKIFSVSQYPIHTQISRIKEFNDYGSAIQGWIEAIDNLA